MACASPCASSVGLCCHNLRRGPAPGFRAPSFRELYLSFANPAAGYRVSGNPDLRAETARSATAGFEWRFSPGRVLSVDYFHHRLRDLIALDGNTLSLVGDNTFRYVNVGSARSQGVEAALSLRFGAGVEAEASYTFTRARDLELGRPLHRRAIQLVDRPHAL